MKTSRLKLAGIVAAIAKEDSKNKLSKELAAFLLSEGRTKELDSLMRDVIGIRAGEGVVEVDVASAREVDHNLEGQISNVIKKLHPEAKHVIVNHRIKPSLIGGIKISLPDEQIDLSIRAKLNKFKQLTSEGSN